MKAKELLKAMLDWADAPVEDTVDCFKIGDPEKEIKKVATCFIATPEVIKAAHAWGADLLVTHEPTFYDHRDHMNNIPDEPIMQKKKALLADLDAAKAYFQKPFEKKAALAYEAAGDKAAALKTYKRIATEYAASVEARDAEKMLGQE